jgi:hypothetical protein
MRRTPFWLSLGCGLAIALSTNAFGATGRVLKVLPHFLDSQGRHSLSPSLYDRDAYQLHLRRHPAERSGMRFDIQWKKKGGVFEPLKLTVELRGVAQGNLPKQLVLEQPVEPQGWFSHWTSLQLTGEDYRDLGEVTAWRVSLWEGAQRLGEQKSFLW